MANANHDKDTIPLSLIPEDEVSEDASDSTKYCSFKLRTAPGHATNTSKYSFTMIKVDGTQSIREHIKWTRNIGKVFEGQELTNVHDQLHMLQEMCPGSALTALNAGIATSRASRWELLRALTVANVPPRDAANGETTVQWQAR